jgi:hypothetical protein
LILWEIDLLCNVSMEILMSIGNFTYFPIGTFTYFEFCENFHIPLNCAVYIAFFKKVQKKMKIALDRIIKYYGLIRPERLEFTTLKNFIYLRRNLGCVY